MVTDVHVLRWIDGGGPTLAEQLRSRPECVAIVGDDLSAGEARDLGACIERLGPEFGYGIAPCDDGPYGVRYEVTARFSPAVRDDEREA